MVNLKKLKTPCFVRVLMSRAYFKILFILILSCAGKSFATDLHLFLPGLQYRYENDSNQALDNRRYDNYNIGVVIFKDYYIGFEFDEYQQTTGLGSLQIKQKLQEYQIYGGYFIYSKEINSDHKVFFDVGPILGIGQNKATVQSNFGNASSQSNGENNLVLSLGLQATLRVGYFLLQPEVKYSTSRVYQPESVLINAIRLGININLD